MTPDDLHKRTSTRQKRLALVAAFTLAATAWAALQPTEFADPADLAPSPTHQAVNTSPGKASNLRSLQERAASEPAARPLSWPDSSHLDARSPWRAAMPQGVSAWSGPPPALAPAPTAPVAPSTTAIAVAIAVAVAVAVAPPPPVPAFPYQTLKARAENPAGPWVKQPEVMSVAAIPGTFYADTASPGQVIEHHGEYLMFFSAAERDGSGIKRTLGLARTPDLNSAWTVDAKPLLPVDEQIENSTLYFESSSSLWFLFTNHIGIHPETLEEYTDAVWVYWSSNLTHWNPDHKAVVLDRHNCTWSPNIVGLPSEVKIGSRLALYYDGCISDDFGHMGRDVGLAWLELPMVPSV